VECTDTQVTAEAQTPSAQGARTRAVEAGGTHATDVSQIPSAGKSQTQTTTESANLDGDKTQIKRPEETYTHTKTAEYKCTLPAEDFDIEFPETRETETTEGSKPLVLKGKNIPFC